MTIAWCPAVAAFANALPMLIGLHAARRSALVVDCGDFFEGSGYYRLAQGRLERDVLTALYDVIAPGNHGWAHHFEPALHELTVCANVFDNAGGEPSSGAFTSLTSQQARSPSIRTTRLASPQTPTTGDSEHPCACAEETSTQRPPPASWKSPPSRPLAGPTPPVTRSAPPQPP